MMVSEEVCRTLHFNDWMYNDEIYAFCGECNCLRKWRRS